MQLLLAASVLVHAASAAVVPGGMFTLRPSTEGRSALLRGVQSNLGLRGGAAVDAAAAKPPTASVVSTETTASGTVKVVLRFRTNYKTRFGENMVIVGSLAEFGEVEVPSATNVKKAAWEGKGARMQYIADDDWGLDMAVELDPTTNPAPSVHYRYVVVDDNGAHPPIPEGGARSGRVLTLAGSLTDYPAVMEVRDLWKSPTSADQLMLSSAFTEVIFNDPQRKSTTTLAKSSKAGKGSASAGESLIVRLALTNPRVERGHVMGVIGSCSSLGAWEDGKVTPMSAANFPLLLSLLLITYYLLLITFARSRQCLLPTFPCGRSNSRCRWSSSRWSTAMSLWMRRRKRCWRWSRATVRTR